LGEPIPCKNEVIYLGVKFRSPSRVGLPWSLKLSSRIWETRSSRTHISFANLGVSHQDPTRHPPLLFSKLDRRTRVVLSPDLF
jgi:hypothetical protein